MQTVKTTLLILICISVLGACGLRGPLYLPEENPSSGSPTEEVIAPVTDETEDEEDTEENNGRI